MSNLRIQPNHFTPDELMAIGLLEFGEEVLIDRSARLFNPQKIRIGSHVRIDAFAVLAASNEAIVIGNNVHLAVAVTLLGNAGIVIEDFCGLSAHVSVFTSNDDYSGGWLTNPTVPNEFRNVKTAPVVLRRHAIVGAGSVILPGVTLGLGASVGALSLVNKSVPDFMIVAGNPIQRIGYRDRSILDRENELMAARQKGRGCE